MSNPNHINLPDYDTPPVVETVIGVQFQRLLSLSNAHLGAFWVELGHDEWNAVEDKPRLARQEERFVPEGQWGKKLNLQFTQDPSERLQIKNNDGNRMIQIQDDRFHLNWLGKDGDDYPRFPTVRNEFLETFNKFQAFLDHHNIDECRPDHWEITYVNHIPQGELWESPADWGFFKPLAPLTSIEGLIEGESFSGQWHFVIPGQRGRLHVEWDHIKLQDIDEEIIRINFTARGSVDLEGTTRLNEAVLAGVELGRETIVRSFRELMDETANDRWGLK
jgi:uncharacterized protein (TIGR04255 family)